MQRYSKEFELSYEKQLGLEDIQVRSSIRSRTILSAYSQLLGMFGDREWESEFYDVLYSGYTLNQLSKTKEVNELEELGPKVEKCMLQFEPIIEIHEEGDITFQMNKNNCSLFQTMLDPKVLMKGEIQKVINNFDKFIMQWSQQHYSNLSNYQYVDFCKYLVAIEEHNLNVRNEISDTKISGEILDICIDYVYVLQKARTTKNLMYSKFVASQLTRDIINAFDNAMDDLKTNTTNHPIFYFDSWHDDNIIAVLNLFGINYQTIIPFAGSLFIELHEDDSSGTIFVKLYFDEEELDINIMAHSDYKDNNVVHHSHSKSYTPQLFDEPDKDSSYYYYLKRYLLRRVFVENVTSYWDKSFDDSIFLEYGNHNEAFQNKIFFLLIIASCLFVFAVAVVICLWVCFTKKRNVDASTSTQDVLTAQKLQGDHHVFVDEEDSLPKQDKLVK